MIKQDFWDTFWPNSKQILTEAVNLPKNDRFEVKQVSEANKFLYEVDYIEVEYDYSSKLSVVAGKCSSLRKKNLVGRNLDWNYLNTADFVLRIPATEDRLASIGMATNPKIEIDNLGAADFEKLPLGTVDGINEAGVAINCNVVPIADLKKPNNITGKEGKLELDSMQVCRYVLDHCKSVEEAIKALRNDIRIVPNKFLVGDGFETHWMISDKTTTVIIEIIDDKIVVIDCGTKRAEDGSVPSMLNFFRNGVKFNKDGSLYSVKDNPDHSGVGENKYGVYSDGIERSNLINKYYDDIKTVDDMMDILSLHLDGDGNPAGLAFSNTYFAEMNDEFWYSEYLNKQNGLTNESEVEDFNTASVLKDIEDGKEVLNSETREKAGIWCTIHSCVYEINTKKLHVISQEGQLDNNKVYEFEL